MSETIDLQEKEKRPQLLLVLAILSFIAIGFSILINLFGVFNGPMSEDDLLKQRVEYAKSKRQMRDANMDGMVVFFDKLEGMIEETNDNFYFSKVVMFITDFIGLFGVIFMLKRRKLGFHLYIVYSLFALGGMYLYVSPQNVHVILPILNTIFTGLFIFLYSRTLHWMR